MKKIIQNLSILSLVAASAVILSSCASKGGGHSCCGTCSAEKSCPTGCTKPCCAKK